MSDHTSDERAVQPKKQNKIIKPTRSPSDARYAQETRAEVNKVKKIKRHQKAIAKKAEHLRRRALTSAIANRPAEG